MYAADSSTFKPAGEYLIMTEDNSVDTDDRPDLLLVDDDETFCHVLAQALGKRGFAVRVAHDVAGGLAAAAESAPEYAVVDLNMPGPSGLELVQQLKSLDEHTRIVVLTGYASVATAVEAIKLGAVHYLAKPADADEVVAAFHRETGDAGRETPGVGGTPRMGAYPEGADGVSGKCIRNRASSRHAPAYPATQTGKAPGQILNG